jgi:hypothetical protein
LYLPKVSRDEIKEGYVSTFGVKHDHLPEDTNSKVNEIFFATALGLLRSGVSVVLEAAFQHKVWNLVVPRIQEVAHPFIVICDLDAETSAKRHLERGLSDPKREFFHGDRRVAVFRTTGRLSSGGPYVFRLSTDTRPKSNALWTSQGACRTRRLEATLDSAPQPHRYAGNSCRTTSCPEPSSTPSLASMLLMERSAVCDIR